MATEKYFDKDRLEEIMKKENIDIYGAIHDIEIYCSQYPKDRVAKHYYARMLIKVGRLVDAEDVLNQLEALIEEASKKRINEKQKNNLDKDENSLRGTRLKLLMWQGKYEEALAYYQKYGKSISKSNETTHLPRFCCHYLLGHMPKDIDPTSIEEGYVYKQLLKYQEETFLNYVKNRGNTNSENEADSSDEITFFDSAFPLDEIYRQVKDIIEENKAKTDQEAKRINLNFPLVSYTFSYPLCGMSKGNNIANYFTVVAFSGTSNIIKMYPSEVSQNYPHFDLTTMTPPTHSGVKQKLYTPNSGQIARFNKRFGLK